MKHLELSDEEAEYLLELVGSVQDAGPFPDGWQSVKGERL